MVALLSACGEPETFKGTVLTSGASAPGFELINQFGGQVNSDDYLGSPVLLTFLYTSCPDVCPITAGQLRETLDLLGEEADRVRVAAISVDPERDTVEAAREFSDRWDMADAWDYLVGSREVLEPLWRAYYIDPAIEDHASSAGSRSSFSAGWGDGVASTELRRALSGGPLQPCLSDGRRRCDARSVHVPAGPGRDSARRQAAFEVAPAANQGPV